LGSDSCALAESKAVAVPEPALNLPKSTHLRAAADFARVYDQKCKASTEHLLIFAANNSTTETRFGLSVSKKNGGAVQRNLIKRRLREAFRHERASLPSGLDLILIPKQSTHSTLNDYRDALHNVCPKLALRLRENQ